MLAGHLAVGLIGADALERRGYAPTTSLAFLFGCVAPDLDLVWWNLVTQRQIPHHLLLPHVPITWLVVLAVAALFWLAGARPPAVLSTVTAGAALLHLGLDWHAGGIAWLYPWSDRMYYAFAMPNVHGNFVISALRHWTFLLEFPLILWAGGVVWRRRPGAGERPTRGARPG